MDYETVAFTLIVHVNQGSSAFFLSKQWIVKFVSPSLQPKFGFLQFLKNVVCD